MNTKTSPVLDVNVLMEQIRETTAAPKTVAAPAPAPAPAQLNRNVTANNGAPAIQESFVQQTLIQLQKNAVLQNSHMLGQEQRLHELKQKLDALTKSLQHPASKNAPVYLGKGRLFIKTQHELPLIVPSDDLHITAALITEGTWDQPLTKIFQRFIKNDMAYLEIGTHIGYFTTMAAALVGYRGKVHAFEPNPLMFEFLEANMSLNRCTHIAKLIQRAASNQTGKTTFHIFTKNAGNSTLSELPERLLEEWRERPTQVEVNCTTLDEFYANEPLQFDFIKIDAEGAEPLIFDGGRNFFQNQLKPTTILAMEFNPPAIKGLKRDPKVFAQSLFDSGFKLWRINGVDDFQPVLSPGELDEWCITELLLSRAENLPGY